MIKLEIMKWGDYLGGSNMNTRVLMRGRQMVRVGGGYVTMERVRLRFEDAALLTLKMEEGAMSQGMQTASKNWKRQWNVQPPEGTQPWQHLDFSPIRSYWTSDLQNCKIIICVFVCFSVLLRYN